MSLQDSSKRLAALEGFRIPRVRVQLDTFGLEERRLSRQLPRRFVFARELAGRDFAGFNIRLVERIDTDDGTGDGCGNLLAEKFFADCVWILHGDAHDGLARFLQGFYRRVLTAIRSGLEAEVSK